MSLLVKNDPLFAYSSIELTTLKKQMDSFSLFNQRHQVLGLRASEILALINIIFSIKASFPVSLPI